MKTEDNLSLKLSLRARLRLSSSFVEAQSMTSRKKCQLSRLYKRSSHIKKIISKALSSKQRLRRTQAKRVYEGMVKTRSRAKKDLEWHPFRQLVSRNVDPKTFKRFLREAYEGAVYSAKHLEPIELQ